MKTKKILALSLAAVLLVAVAVGGTMAYLQATSKEVTNTFLPTTLSVDINEHDYDPETNTLNTTVTKENSDYKVVPGVDIPKDPYVTFSSDVSCYVFVTVAQENWNANLTYEIDPAWKAVSGVTGVYYQEFVDDTTKTDDFPMTVTADAPLYVLKDNKVVVNNALDLAGMATIKEKAPKLTFDAFIIQKAGFDTPAAAWAVAKDSVNPN